MVSGLFAWSSTRSYPEPTLRQPLAELLPTGAEEGWSHEDLPLGATESQDAKAHEILGLTDFVYRRYTRGGKSFEIYVAYWAPGKMPPRLMNSHTPDTCWVNAGWTNVQSERRSLDTESPAAIILDTLPIPDLTNVPGRWRIFEKGEARLPVIFWHIVSGEPYQYGHQSLGQRFKQLVLDPFTRGEELFGEQWLVRVSNL